jgi:hypothetical protein
LAQSKNETAKLKNKGGKHGKKRGVTPSTVWLGALRDRQINVPIFCCSLSTISRNFIVLLPKLPKPFVK